MTETTTIALSKLLAWEGNVRKTNPDKGIHELAASIEAHGLLQSLVVRKDKRGKYAVVAGRRRLLALKSLADAGKLKAHLDIPCTVIDADADATEISLVENVQREPMHPADEFDAFKALVDSGMPLADVAARFGVTETVVQKRLKLARVNPALLKAYREGEMTMQHVMAFTVTDDHAEQERVWNELSDWQKRDPDNIRNMLTEHEITASDRRVKFVTLKSYEKAGGILRRDLFSEGDDEGVFIEDAVLLESLVAKKLEKAADKIRKEGWKWVEVRPSFDHEEWSKCERRHAESIPMTTEEEAEFNSLTAEYEALAEIEENDDHEQARMEAISDRMNEIEDRPETWPPETLAIAGAVVTLGHNGEASVHAGIVKPEDAPAKTAKRKAASDNEGGSWMFSASLIESLTAHRSAALNAELIRRPDVALAALVSGLIAQIFEHGRREHSALQFTVFEQTPHRVEESPAHAAITAERDKWWAYLPIPEERLSWCLLQEQEVLLRLLAYCVAQTVDAVKTKQPQSEERIAFTDTLASALNLDMGKWFKPTAENYFGKISKAQSLDALRDAKGSTAPAWADMKKADLAALAERQIAGTDWLPEPLRAVPKTAD